MADNNSKLRLYSDYWSEDKYTDENSLSKAMLTKPDVLSPVITHLAGKEDKRFPLSFLTEGIGNVKYVNDVQYRYPVMGRMNKALVASSATGTGLGHARFKINFPERHFIKQYIIENGDGVQARIMDEPEESPNGGWDYTAQLTDPSSAASVAEGDIVGKKWVQQFAPVALSGSRGNESNWVAPSEMTNQLTQIRKSYGYEGNAQNQVAVFQFNVNGKSTNLWYDFEEYQHMLKWKEEVESAYWYARYNRDSDGIVHMKDDNGKPIPIGSGVIEQIPNYDSYATLTAKKLKATVRDTLYGATDSQKMNIVLYTGLGGLEEFDNAMKAEVANGSYIKNTDPSTFITGSGRNLSLGGFFTSYQHIDGHMITVRHLPLFDHGARALASAKHPKTGLPLESYRMIFLDMSTYDGQPNISQVTMKGREMIRWAVAGATVPKGFNGNDTRASDIDGASVHFMKMSGINIRRATNCMHLECIKQ